jgi:hypothetical protein
MSSPSEQILRMGIGFALSQAVRVVAELGIADLLVGREQTADELATASGANADALYRVMRLLASEGVFRETSVRRFAQTELSAALLTDAPRSPRDMVRMMNREPYLAFGDLLYSVRTGKPAFEHVFGAPRFDWLDAHPEETALFQQAMIALSQGANEAVAEAFDFTPFKRVADVGGGHGQLLSAILARNPHLSGILFDRPASIEAAKTGLGGPLPGTEFVVGDFFNSVPKGGDVYVLKRVIHDWDDERAAAILSNCRAVMPPAGRVLVAERITEEGNDPDLNKYLDIAMLTITGGIERTQQQFEKLFGQAGLRLERVIRIGTGISVLEARTAS